jgi:hypothetical protein
MGRIWIAALMIGMAVQAQAADLYEHDFINGVAKSSPSSSLGGPTTKLPSGHTGTATSGFRGLTPSLSGPPLGSFDSHESTTSPYGTSSEFSKGYFSKGD